MPSILPPPHWYPASLWLGRGGSCPQSQGRAGCHPPCPQWLVLRLADTPGPHHWCRGVPQPLGEAQDFWPSWGEQCSAQAARAGDSCSQYCNPKGHQDRHSGLSQGQGWRIPEMYSRATAPVKLHPSTSYLSCFSCANQQISLITLDNLSYKGHTLTC